MTEIKCGQCLCEKDCARVFKTEYAYDNTSSITYVQIEGKIREVGYGMPDFPKWIPKIVPLLTACKCGVAAKGNWYNFWRRLFPEDQKHIHSVIWKSVHIRFPNDLYKKYGLDEEGAG